MDDPHLKLFRNKLSSTDKRVGSDGFICTIRILSNDFRIEFLALKQDWQSPVYF
jgi:hypothetical protein